MKILLDARFYGLEHAGLGRYTINLIQELAKLDTKNEYIFLLRKKHMGINLPKNFKKAKVEAKHYSFKEQLLLPLVISKYKPDVVHFLHSNIPLFYKGKFIVTIHDLTMYNQGLDATTLPIPLYYAKRIPFKLIFKKAVYDSTKIITPSEAVRGELVEYFKIPKEKVVVTYESVDRREQTTENRGQVLDKYNLDNKKYFLYVGNVYPHKNIGRAIEAMVSLNQESRIKNQGRIYFVIVSGRGVFRKRLEVQIQKLNAKKYVKVLDFVPDNELSTLYKNALAFIFPSLSEGFGLPGLEAMESETLVLASDIPVFREIYKNDALYFDPKKIESIKDAMEKVLTMKKDMRLKKIIDAKKLVREYSWEKMAQETLAIYMNLTNDHFH